MPCIILSCVMAACSGGRTDDTPVLTVSIEPQRKMLEELVGDRFSVVTLLGPGTDPESFEPTMSQRVAISETPALFTVGHLPFEPLLARSVGENAIVVDTSEGIEVVTGTHSHGHGETHVDADPHVWTSLRNGKIMAANMLRALVDLDPEHTDEYNARYERMMHRLDSIDGVVDSALRNSGAHAFAIWHPSLSYFARDYGLNQVIVGNAENKDNSVNDLRTAIDSARSTGARIFFFQKDIDSRQVSAINSELQSDEVNINPLSYQWEDEIIRIADAIAGNQR